MSVTTFTVKTRTKYKLILLGDQSVGKTCLIQQFVNGKFDDTQSPTVGIDFVVTNIHYKNKQYRLQLWDTAGQQRFKSLIPSYLRDSQCALILYDVSNKQSYENVTQWLKLYQDNVQENSLVVVVGNKIDLKIRNVDFNEANSKFNKINLQHIEVSAKTGKNITQLFHKVIQLIEQRQNKPILDQQILQTIDPAIQKSQRQQNQMPSKVKLTVSSHKDLIQNKQSQGQNKSFKKKQKCC